MGSYDTNGDGVKESINWVIIGRHSTTTSGFANPTYSITLAQYFLEKPYGSTLEDWLANYYETTTDAGLVIDENGDRGLLMVEKNGFASLNLTLSSKEATSETIDAELDPGEILVISEGSICSSTTAHNYKGSALETKLTNLFEKELNFTEAQKKLIMPQYLKNIYGASSVSYTSSAYLFPLACRGENFSVGTYLTTAELRKGGGIWWLRSGSSYSGIVYFVHGSWNGNVYYNQGNTTIGYSSNNWGVRPAFVLKI